MIRNLFIELSSGLSTKIEQTEEAVQLADTYLAEKVVGKTSRVDCFHIEMCKGYGGYNSVNMKLGYPTIDIRSPKELFIMNTKKTVKKEQKEFDAVEFMRERRTKMAGETEGMNFAELKKYFGQKKGKTNQIISRLASAG